MQVGIVLNLVVVARCVEFKPVNFRVARDVKIVNVLRGHAVIETYVKTRDFDKSGSVSVVADCETDLLACGRVVFAAVFSQMFAARRDAFGQSKFVNSRAVAAVVAVIVIVR